jgi:hypothetical protein
MSSSTNYITSLFVGRTSAKTSAAEIKTVIDTFLGGDAVLRTDFVLKKDGRTGRTFKTAFIHFNQWPDTDVSIATEATILAGEPVQIPYNETGYWKCYQNKMDEPTDLRSVGVFIPRVDADTTETLVRETFKYILGTDIISRIDFIPKKDRNDAPYLATYIHFNTWPDTDISNEVQQKLLAGEDVNVFYGAGKRDMWKCVLNRNANGSGRVIDRREVVKPDKNAAPYVQFGTAPTTPPANTIPLAPPVLRRNDHTDVGMSATRQAFDVSGCPIDIGANANLAAAFETARGIDNRPAWMSSVSEEEDSLV